MSTYSTELDPFIDALRGDAVAGNFGPSFDGNNFKNAKQFDRALVQIAFAELLDAMADNAGGDGASPIATAVKFDQNKIISEGQKQTFGTGSLGQQAPHGVQHS